MTHKYTFHNNLFPNAKNNNLGVLNFTWHEKIHIIVLY